METGTITTQSSLISAASTLQNTPREERAETIDSASEEQTEVAKSLSQPNQNFPAISESGLKLSANFQSRPAEITESSAIENNTQAQQAINKLNIDIQKSPFLAGAAQSNLTSNVVQSLLS